MENLWKGRYDVFVLELEVDLFLFQFGCDGDRTKVLLGQPWHFSNHPIVVRIPKTLQNICNDSLTTIPFWVQVYRLPFLSRTWALAQKVGEWLGTFIEVDFASLLDGWGPYMRVRVSIDITKPFTARKNDRITKDC